MEKIEISSEDCMKSIAHGHPIKMFDADPALHYDVVNKDGDISKVSDGRIVVPLIKDSKMPEGEWDEIQVTSGQYEGHRGYFRRHFDA